MASGVVSDAESVRPRIRRVALRVGSAVLARLASSRVAYSSLAAVGVIAAVGYGITQVRSLTPSAHVNASPSVAPRVPAEPPSMDNIAVVKTPFLDPAGLEQPVPAAQGSVVTLPFQPADADRVVPPGLVAPGIPSSRPDVSLGGSAVVTNPPKSPPPVAENRGPSRTPKGGTEKRPDEPKALILDVAKSDLKAQGVDAAAVKSAPKESTVGEAGKRLVGPVAEQSARLAAAPVEDTKRVRIVDIGQDGSFVLITNPQTRLPQKFTVGQTIFTGETLQKIDAAKGTIQLDSRTVGLQ